MEMDAKFDFLNAVKERYGILISILRPRRDPSARAVL